MADILTADHPMWDEFLGLLEGPEGCNFHKDENDKTRWDCAGGKDQSLAEAILRDLGGINVPRTLEHFSRHGGHCDCEILFNVTLEPEQREAAVVSIGVTAGYLKLECPACGNHLHDQMDYDHVAHVILDPDDETTHDIAVVCLKQTSDADDAAVCGAEVAGYNTMAHLRRQIDLHDADQEKFQSQLDATKTAIGRRAEHFGGRQ